MANQIKKSKPTSPGRRFRSWVSRDGVKYNMSRGLVSVPLILVYFTGPLGLVLYWIIRVFYAKRLGFHD